MVIWYNVRTVCKTTCEDNCEWCVNDNVTVHDGLCPSISTGNLTQLHAVGKGQVLGHRDEVVEESLVGQEKAGAQAVVQVVRVLQAGRRHHERATLPGTTSSRVQRRPSTGAVLMLTLTPGFSCMGGRGCVAILGILPPAVILGVYI